MKKFVKLPKKPDLFPKHAENSEFPMRINKYLAIHNFATRRGADELIEKGIVTINGKRAKVGDKILETDKVSVKNEALKNDYTYVAYYKPVEVITHSPQYGEKDIRMISKLKDLFPVGRLDKASHGLIILTNDGRVTERLLSPTGEHEKEYYVTCARPLKNNFKTRMERGVRIEGYLTKPCKVIIVNDRAFRVILTEGKRHQIRRMCAALDNEVTDLKRSRVINISVKSLKPNEHRIIEGEEKETFLKSLGL